MKGQANKYVSTGRKTANTPDLMYRFARDWGRWTVYALLVTIITFFVMVARQGGNLQQQPGDVFFDGIAAGGRGPEMVVIPPGVFRMGNLSGEGEDNERPVHVVQFRKPFAMSKYEVTNGQYQQFVAATGHQSDMGKGAVDEKGCYTSAFGYGEGLVFWGYSHERNWRNPGYWLEQDQPVVCVSWHDAQAYAAWLSAETGETYRLPSESEWEYAARAGSESLYHFGDDPGLLCDYGNVRDMTELPNGEVWSYKAECNDGAVYPAGAGRYRPNAFGLYDMHGNAAEWVEDCPNFDYVETPLNGSAWMRGTCLSHAVRGGSWSDSPYYVRAAHRNWFNGADSSDDIGFRLVRTMSINGGRKAVGGKGETQPASEADAPDARAAIATNESIRSLRQPGEEFSDKLSVGGWGPTLVVIPRGVFRMGDLAGDGEDDERPVHVVRLPNPFSISKYEVTVGQFRQFVLATGYRTDAENNAGDVEGCYTLKSMSRYEWDWTPGRSWQEPQYTIEEDQPVVCVSWNDAQAYSAWLSEQTGKTYRLPSEAEWEYAARAGSETMYHFGNEATRLCDYGNVADTTVLRGGNVWSNRAECNDGAVFPVSVGGYQPNFFGLHDIHGNVNEWVQDCDNASYWGAPIDGSTWISGTCHNRLQRGGSWSDEPSSARSAERMNDYNKTTFRSNNTGFRLVRVVTAPGNRNSSTINDNEMKMKPKLVLRQSGVVFQDELAVRGQGPELVVIPAGAFLMGDLTEVEGGAEKPVHEVRIPKPFAMMRHEVTVGQFRQFVAETGYRTRAESEGCFGVTYLNAGPDWKWTVDSEHNFRSPGYDLGENQPVVCVSWDDARAYASWLTEQTGKIYRLPSEAEWEYAARAGSEATYHFGNDSTRLCDYGNVAVNNHVCDDGAEFPAVVGSYQPNIFGLYDMHGNVSEWVEDCWHGSYHGAPADGSAWTSGKCGYRVLRGGSWYSKPQDARSSLYSELYGVRSSFRGHNGDHGAPFHNRGLNDTGFRLVRVL